MANDGFAASLQLANKLILRGDLDDALVAMAPWAESSLPGFEKSILAYNMSAVLQQKGDAQGALGWLDWGIGLQHETGWFVVAEAKADLLSRCGLRAEALTLLLAMQAANPVDAERRARIAAAIAALEAAG